MKKPHYKRKLRHLSKNRIIKKYRFLFSQNPTGKQLLQYPPSRLSPQNVTAKNTPNDSKNGGTVSILNAGQ